jgi:hypothetical protein
MRLLAGKRGRMIAQDAVVGWRTLSVVWLHWLDFRGAIATRLSPV